jgi:hypothetical protein
VPKYYQVGQALRQRLVTLGPGIRLPAALALCREPRVSRATLAAGSTALRVRQLPVHGSTPTALDTLVTPLAPTLRRADSSRSRFFQVLAEHSVKVVRNRVAIESII